MAFERYKKLSAVILLAVFVTMTVFTDFHRHNIVNVLNICENCQHNVPHPQHISSSVSFENICLLCQWTGGSFDITKTFNIIVFLAILLTLSCNILLKYTPKSLTKLTNKAPPYYELCNM